jgi:sporulation protein YlmC with PRC-barrel domain
MLCSAKRLLGLPVMPAAGGDAHPIGTIESVLVDPKSFHVTGLLIGHDTGQAFIHRECVTHATEYGVTAHERLDKIPPKSQRILGLAAWSGDPKLLVGFVQDITFDIKTGAIDQVHIFQLIRTWTLPITAIEKITPKAVLLNNDTTVKLKIQPDTI